MKVIDDAVEMFKEAETVAKLLKYRCAELVETYTKEAVIAAKVASRKFWLKYFCKWQISDLVFKTKFEKIIKTWFHFVVIV